MNSVVMFEYKDAAFFSDFFRNHPDFILIEEFGESEDRNEQNLYVGQVEVKNTIHPLVIRVEIPSTFPHNKLTFRTKSLSGYPHLIHSGNVEKGDWFCLNTPFAETPEEQLNQEVYRLKEWISRTMTNDLEAKIQDPNVRLALAIAHSYRWENPDEVNEFRAKARLTFVGDDIESATSYTEQTGLFCCVKSPDNRVYAFLHEINGISYKIPYIIVKELPSDMSVLDDFLRMKDFYNWDEDICRHLLPDANYKSGKRTSASSFNKYEIQYSEKEALDLINEVHEELKKEESYLEEGDRIQRLFLSTHGIPTSKKVKSSHKSLILDELEKCRKEVIENNGVAYIAAPLIGEDEEYDEEDAIIDHWFEYERYAFHHFAFGFKYGEKISWMVFFTNPASIKTESTSYDVKIRTVNIVTINTLALDWERPQYISKEMFFGRGALCTNFINKRIALVGLGAIGSMVAESLAHSGIQKIGLWDGDIVEAGNICRSTYGLSDIGKSKVEAISAKIQSINPFISTSTIESHGFWDKHFGPNFQNYKNGSFYGNVNYTDQSDAIQELGDYDLILDCTGSNEMLHFLSYALKDKEIISLCITNHAKELVCVTNTDGNPFELRKAYLSRIEQDTKNFYAEGDGCYSPTFLAKYSDISSLVNLCIKEYDKSLADNEDFHSAIFGYCKSGILIDQIHTFRLEGYDIILNVPNETLLDAKELDIPVDNNLGYILGCYSSDGKQILITHIVSAQKAIVYLEDAFRTSKGIIDYIGDCTYSQFDTDSFSLDSLDTLANKASDPDINTNNPLLALCTTSGEIEFYLYINNNLVHFRK